MANNSLSKYVKKPTTRTRSMAQKSGSWVANAFKSVGYSTFDVLQELLPSTIDAAKVTATTGKDIAETIRKVRTSDRTLQQAINRNYYVGLGREVFKNSLDDLKSGKFYNKERADQFFADMNDDMMNFGDFEDFDSGEGADDFSSSVDSSDGNTRAQFNRKKGGNNEVTSVVVNTNLGPDSAMYQATQYQTETMVNVGQAVVDFNKANSRATLTLLGNMRNEVNANLTSINENVSTISTVVGESLGKHSALAAKYFEDSIGLQTQILEQLKLQAPNTQVNTRTFKDYENVQDVFSAGGMLDPKAYAGLVQKQLNSYIDNNMFLSQLKFMAGEKETLKMMAQNPLAFVPKAITKQLIPATVKGVLSEFDAQLKETSIAALNQISGLQRSDNPLLAALGKIFGVQNKLTISTIDKGAYNKGATAWTGTDHQALVNVIPTLLRKIHASVSGSEEIAFNYETGQFQKVRDMEKQFEKDKLQRETSVYSDYKADFKDFMEQNLAISREERDKFSQDFEKFISALVRDQYGGRTFRKGGRNGNEAGRDDIRDLLGKASSDDESVKLIRGFLQGMEDQNNSALTRFFGSALQEQRAHLDSVLREMQADPTKYNTMYMNTGLGEHDRKGKGVRNGIYTDSHLSYHKNDLTKVNSVVGGIQGQDKFGRTQTDYLRDILKTLNTGIYVVPIGRLDGATGDGADRLAAINSRLKSQRDIARREERDYKTNAPKPKQDTYTGSVRQQRDIDQGKISDIGSADIDSMGATYHNALRNERTGTNDSSIIGKLLGMLPQDSGAARMLNRVNSAQANATSKTTDVIKKFDSALFQIVFGNKDGHKGFHALFDKTLGTMKAGFSKFALFLDEKVLKPLDEAIFGENGIVNKVKQTDAWQNFSKFMKESTKKAEKFFLGDLQDGKRVGGLFSETANSLRDMGTHVKESILGKKGTPLEDDNSVLGNLKRMFKNTTETIGKSLGIESNSDETFGTKLANGMDMIYHRIKERAGEFTDNLFGSQDGGPEFLKQFKEDMKGQKGFIGASAVLGGVGGLVLGGHMGLIGSLFLPGGPIGGAILGAGIGIASKSTGLKNALFGPEVDGERTGGLITKEFQDFFKQNKTGIAVGGLAGLAASFGVLPALFVPGGPIGGAIIGGALSMATKTDAFQRLMYGEGGTKDDPTGGISKKLKEAFGKNKDLKGVAVDAGIGAGVGVLGSFFLPGGPILGAMLGASASVGLASEKFKSWFFGEEKDGKREGGIFGKFSGFMKKNVFGPLSTTVKIAQTKILGFVKENMVLPFQYAMKPIVEEAKYIGGVIKQRVTDVFDNIKEKFHEHVTKPIGDAVKEHFLDPMKKMLSKVFSGLGKFVGNLIAAPFRMIGGAGKIAYEGQKARGRKSYNDQLRNDKGFLGSLGYKIFHNKEYRANRKAAQFGENGAWYDPNGDYYDRLADDQARVRAETDAKVAALRNGTSIDTRTVAPEGIGGGASDSSSRGGRPGRLSRRQRRLEAMRRVGIDPNRTSIDTNVKGGNLSQTQLKEYLRNKFSRIGSPTPSGESGDSSYGDILGSERQDRTRISTEPAGSRDRTRATGQSQDSVLRASENNKKGRKAKDSGTFLQRIQKDVSQIASSVYGQLNGVGSNINKIYRTMLKLNKLKDEDIKGDNNKEYVGFFGRIRTALNRPIQAIGDLITAPFRKISELGQAFVGKIKNIGSLFGKAGSALKAGLGAIVKGIGEGAKAIGGVVIEVAKLPFEIIKTGLSAVRAILPALGEAAKGVVNLAVDGIKIAGSLVVNGVKTVGETISGAAKGFGQMLGGAMSGLGKLLSAFGLIGKDVLVGAWKGIKFIGKGIATGVGAVASAPFKMLGALSERRREGKGGLFGRKGPVHVIVDSGTLDTVKRVRHVNGLGGDGLLPGGNGGFGSIKPISHVKPLPGGFGDANKKPIHVVIDDIRKNAFEKIKDKLSSFGKGGKDPLSNLDRNVGDTSVDASMAGGGSADDAAGSDQSLADDDNRTSVATSIANLKASFAEAGQTMSDGFAAIKDKFNSRIAARQAQVDKGSRASMMERFAADEKAKEESEFRTKMLSLMGKNTEVATEHKSIFSSIFSKKGLITAGIIALLPFLLKLFKNFNIGGLLSMIAGNTAQGLKDVGGVPGVINNMEEKADQVTSVATGKEQNYKIDENGNLVYDENGNLVKEEERTSRLKALLTPTKTRIDTKTGEWEQRNDWTNMSGSTANVIAHKAVIPGLKGIDKTIVAGKAIVDSKVGKAVIGGAKSLGKKIYNSTAVTAAYTYADDAIKAVGKSKAVTAVAGAAKKVAGSDLVQTFITKAGEALKFLTTKLIGVGEKFGLKLGEGQFATVLKSITKILNPKTLGKYAAKIGDFLKTITGKSTVAGATAFIAEIGFVVYGAIEGAVNAAGLFEVPSDRVDAKMRAIAAVFKGLLGTTVGSVIDFINSLAYEIIGTNFIRDIATHTYNLLSNEEDKEAMKAAQDDFTKGYHDYVNEEYEAYKKSTEAQGQTAMSLDEFKASDLVTTRSEYNSKVNKSLFRRGLDAVKAVPNAFKKAGKGIKRGATAVWTAVKGGPKAWGEGIKQLGSNAWEGAKNLGGRIANSKFGQTVGSVGSKIGEGASAVFNKGKEIFGKVGNGVLDFAKQGADAGKGLLSGWKTIADTFYNKDNSFLDYFKADVNPVKEDNMFHGIVGAMLNISKITMFPKLLVAGILKKIGTAIAGAATKIFTGAKNAFTDYATNVRNLDKLAFAGDIEGLSQYEIQASEDNPVAGFTSGMAGISRIMHYPIALVSKAARKVADTVRGAIVGVKTAAGDYATNVANISQLAFSGNLEGLSNYEVITSDDNPISGFTSGLIGITRLSNYPVGLVAAAGKKVVSTVKNAISAVVTTGQQIGTGSIAIGKLALSGDVSAMHDYQGVDEEGNPVGGFANAVLGVEKVLMSPVAYATSVGKKIVETVKGAIGTVVDYGSKSKDFISKLKTYTDPDKDMGGWDKESMASGDDDVVGHVLGTIIKKVMWVYVGIVRNIKKAFDWVEDAADTIKDAAGTAVDTVKDKASSAASWIGDKINSAGTAIMNLGRGGEDGGRPLYGGKGGGTEVLNGMPYYSQNDPKYKDKPYHLAGGQGGDTIGDAGCGPTAMAMVASKVTGKEYNPVTMTKMAEAGGYGTRVGTTPGYFSAAGNALGIPNAQQQPSVGNLQQSLANGNSVILQGAKGAGGGSANSPYTSEGHYVTATGIDKNNNVLVNDPRGKQYSGAYRMSDLMQDTTGMWSFATGGKGGSTGIHKIISTIIPSNYNKDTRLSFRGLIAGKGGNNFKAEDVIKIAKNEIGYEEKASNSNLYDPHANKGSANYTKYEQEVFGLNGNYWCASFVSWCFVQAANGDKSKAGNAIGKLSRACEEIRKAMMAQGRYDRTARPGDLIFFQTTTPGVANHIGIVVDVQGNNVITVEGNTSSKEFNANGGCVASHTYDINYGKTLGFGHPKYDGVSNFKGITASSSGSTGDFSPSSSSSGSTTSASSGPSSFADLFTGLADAVTKPIYERFGISTDSGSTSVGTSSYTGGDTSGPSMISGGADGYKSNTTDAKFGGKSIRYDDLKTLPKLSQSQLETILLKAWVPGSNGKSSIFTQSNYKSAASGIAKAQDEVNLSAIIPMSIGAWESGWGTSNIAKQKGNLWGWNATNANPMGNATAFGNSTYDAFKGYSSKLLSTYYDKYGAHSIESIGTGKNPAGKGYAYNDNGTISTSWAPSVTSVGKRQLGFIGDAGKGGKDGGRPLYGGFGGETIGDAGCGPTAMAMVASKVTGKDYNPVTMARMAEDGGYATQVGTTPGYFSAAGNALGIPNAQIEPSASNLQQSLANGDSVILQGARGGFGNSPYTSEGHYVTATGVDKDKVYINDPRGKEYSGAYRLKDVMNDTTGMWSFGGMGGFGSNPARTKLLKGGKGSSADYEKWISICRAVKQAIAAQHPGYSQSRYITITVGGRSMKARTDCSGYVQTCLKYFGVMPENSNITSGNVTNAGDATMKATGFTPMSWPGWENLKEGDIMGTSGHTEIFAYNKDGAHYVYNCGSDSSTNSATPTRTGHSAYTTIWRCGGAGSGALSSFGVSGGATADGTTATGTTDSGSTGGSSSFGDIFSGLSDAVMKPIYEKFGINVGSTNSGTTSVDGGASTGGDTGAFSAANLSGGDTAQKVWNYFTGAGYSKQATAGILGNMEQESGVNPASIQNNGKGPAAGIVQWENYNTKSSRWKALSDYAASKGKDWTDLGSQLEFIDKELKGLGSFWSYAPNMSKAGTTPTSYDAWKQSTSVDTATRQFEGAFERAGKPMMDKRISAANAYFNKFSGGMGGKGGGRPISKVDTSRALGTSLQSARVGGRGYGNVSQASYSVLDTLTPAQQSALTQDRVRGSIGSDDMSQLLKVAVDYLSKIVDNTGETNTELDALNKKDFGGRVSQTNNTTNLVDNSAKSYNSGSEPKNVADRSEYAMAKRVAAGILD